MTQEEFMALERVGRQPTPAQVEDYNETLRQWRAVCQVCGLPIVGTLAVIRAHGRNHAKRD